MIHEQLGSGGMASVHLAETPAVTQRVALKRLYPQIAEVPELLASFIDEARLARYLKHPNIARVYEFGRIKGTYFIAFEYVRGTTVQQLQRQCAEHVGPIPIAVAIEIASQLCEALDHAHHRKDDAGEPLGIVHRDVSPQNLIISNSGLVKLIDFGLAKAKYQSVQSHVGIIKGKLNYVAPEYLRGKLDARCDLWAVGVLLHELLTGRRLFDGADEFATLEAVRSRPIAPPSRFSPQVSPALDEIVLTALQRDPAKRWQSAADLRLALATHAKLTFELTKPQLVAWIEWAFSQKQRIREDSGVSALHEIMSGQIEVVELDDDVVDEPSVASRLPAISAAMLQRRRESAAMMPIGAAMLHRRSSEPWLWLVLVLAIAAAVAVWWVTR